MTSDFSQILDVERLTDHEWSGVPGPAFGPRLFGGQAIAQGLVAASRAEDDGKLAHSMHAHFLKAGKAAEPVRYTVQTLTKGRSFATRRVDGWQGEDTLILSMTVSFHAPEDGFSHQDEAPYSLDFAAAQESLESWKAHNERAAQSSIIKRLGNRPIEIVPLDPGSIFGMRPREPRTGSWMRIRETLGNDAVMQRAAMSYASDMMFLRNSLLPYGVRIGVDKLQAASLDHTVWFHETPDFNEWHLFATGSPWAGHARGLNQGHFFSQSGKLVATVAQESLMRPLEETRDRALGQEVAG